MDEPETQKSTSNWNRNVKQTYFVDALRGSPCRSHGPGIGRIGRSAHVRVRQRSSAGVLWQVDLRPFRIVAVLPPSSTFLHTEFPPPRRAAFSYPGQRYLHERGATDDMAARRTSVTLAAAPFIPLRRAETLCGALARANVASFPARTVVPTAGDAGIKG